MDAMHLLPKDGRYTYADYAKWPDDVRYELIDGKAYLMAAPGTAHQKISGELFVQLRNFLRGKPCLVLAAPYDVCLNGAGDDDDTVVQPDLLVVCDRSKLDGKRCSGAPDMVIEILSRSTSGRDAVLKFNKYLQTGVREYWIVNPENKTVSAHILKNKEYVASAYSDTDTAPVQVLDGCQINLSDVFSEWQEEMAP